MTAELPLSTSPSFAELFEALAQIEGVSPGPESPVCDRCRLRAGRVVRFADGFKMCAPCMRRLLSLPGDAP